MEKIVTDNEGLFMIGVLDGVDFVEAGSTVIDGKPISYGSAVKLKFNLQQRIIKKISGVDVPVEASRSQILKITCETAALPSLVSEYMAYLGKKLKIELVSSDNATFRTNSKPELIK